jgi:hypothetical protein
MYNISIGINEIVLSVDSSSRDVLPIWQVGTAELAEV